MRWPSPPPAPPSSCRREIAATPADKPIGVEGMVGSGPWRFLPGEFVQGARAAYARE
ncbi:hypothetical protein [Dankookia sp. P2]|uniref:hypothetical protein n=1 Tax=Dankookia sp. P2 TaxID=3423955 RepID=UPI003D672F22